MVLGVAGVVLAPVFSLAAFSCHFKVPSQYLSLSLSNFSSHLPTGSLQAERRCSLEWHLTQLPCLISSNNFC